MEEPQLSARWMLTERLNELYIYFNGSKSGTWDFNLSHQNGRCVPLPRCRSTPKVTGGAYYWLNLLSAGQYRNPAACVFRLPVLPSGPPPAGAASIRVPLLPANCSPFLFFSCAFPCCPVLLVLRFDAL